MAVRTSRISVELGGCSATVICHVKGLTACSWNHTMIRSRGRVLCPLSDTPHLDVTGYDAGLFVVPGSIACQLQHLSSKVLKDCCHVHRGTSTNALSIAALLQVPVPTGIDIMAPKAL